MKKQIVTTYFFLFMLCLSFGQDDVLVELNDIETSEPVAFATIRFKGTSRGLVADYYGQFRLPKVSVDSLTVIVITSMGYKTLEVDVNSLLPKQINRIELVPQIETLDEVILEVGSSNKKLIETNASKTAYEIVNFAVNGIKFNLDESPHAYIGYYRDYQLLDNDYCNLNEGILKQFDNGINTHKVVDSSNQGAFYSYKQNTDFKTDSYLSKAYDGQTKYINNASISSLGGNELSILNIHNPIRSYKDHTFSFVYRLNYEFLRNHRFTKGAISRNNNVPVIYIDFTNIKNRTSSNHKVSGRLMISLLDFKIFNFTYNVFDFNVSNPLFSIGIEYKEINNFMYLNYITFNNRFTAASSTTFKQTEIALAADEGFTVSFNSDLDVKTLDRRNFYILYKKQRIIVKSIQILGPRKIKLIIKKSNAEALDINSYNAQDFSFGIKELKDVQGRVINRPERKDVYQFREFFVQEVILETELDTTLNFIDKLKPLNQSLINFNDSASKYIINSPLRQSTSQ